MKVIVSVDHSASNHKYHTHTHAGTQQLSCISECRRRTPTQHLRDWQHGDRSLPLFKMTTRVVKRCILSGQMVQAAGPVTKDNDSISALVELVNYTYVGEKSYCGTVVLLVKR